MSTSPEFVQSVHKMLENDRVNSLDEQTQNIPVDTFLEFYFVENSIVKETLRTYPTLNYLLGDIVNTEKGWLVSRGSAMFNLSNTDDAKEWAGIANHIFGNARQVYTIASALSTLSNEQKQQFANKGYNVASFKDINPSLLAQFVLLSHRGRRARDEHDTLGIIDDAHPEGSPGEVSLFALENDPVAKPHPYFLSLMRNENANALEKLAKEGNGKFTDMVTNILCLADWTFGVEHMTLEERFKDHQEKRRDKQDQLNTFYNCGKTFLKDVEAIVGSSLMTDVQETTYLWEIFIREAYCVSANLDVEEIFPQFYQQFSQLKRTYISKRTDGKEGLNIHSNVFDRRIAETEEL